MARFIGGEVGDFACSRRQRKWTTKNLLSGQFKNPTVTITKLLTSDPGQAFRLDLDFSFNFF